MPTVIEQMAHQRQFFDWLSKLQTAVKNGVVPNATKALSGYQNAANAFAAGGLFDAVTEGDDNPFLEQNQGFQLQFGALMQAIYADFPVPAEEMNVVEIFEWAIQCLYAIETAQPGTFGIELPEEEDPPEEE